MQWSARSPPLPHGDIIARVGPRRWAPARSTTRAGCVDSIARMDPAGEGTGALTIDKPSRAGWRAGSVAVRLGGLRPYQVAALALAITLSFVGLRVLLGGDRDITAFILAGSEFTDASRVPGDIHVFDGPGNDGQFNYRYALDPTTLGTAEHRGIALDLPLRAGRIGYPAIVWVVSLGGRTLLVPYALVAVNIAGLVAIAWMGAILAERWNRAPIEGLLLPAWCGFLFALSRDYADIAGAALCVGAIVVGPRRRPELYGLLLAAAALSRELYLALALGLLAERLWDVLRSRALRIRRSDLAWAIPITCYASWQFVAWTATGSVPLLSGSDNRSLPVVGLLDAVRTWLGDIASFQVDGTTAAMALLAILQFVVLVTFCIAAVRALAWPPVVEGVTTAWVAIVVLSLMLSADVWAAYNDFRNVSEIVVLGTVILLSSKKRLLVPAGAVSIGWLATSLPRILRP